MAFALQKSKIILWQLFSLKKHLKEILNSDEAFVNLTKVYFDDGRILKAIEVAKKGLLLNSQIIFPF